MTTAELVKDHKKRRAQDQAYWGNHRRDVQRFITPGRERAGGDGGQSPGSRRVDHVYDSTAISAAMRGAGKLKKALTPDQERWFMIKPGPMFEGDDKAKREKALMVATELAWSVLSSGSFSAAADDAYVDLYGGDCCLLVLPGDMIEHMAIFRCIPTEDVTIDEDAQGRPALWGYPQKMAVSKIASLPGVDENKLPEDLKKMIKDDGGQTQTVLYHCKKIGPFKYDWQVVWQEGEHALHKTELRTSPFVTPRFWHTPGEKRGRGPAMLALPHVKTLNKTIELQLKAAQFAILGVWAVTDDQLFNARTTNLKPGGMLKVSMLGSQRRSIERMDVPHNFDLTSIVASELRAMIKEILYDDPLPDQGESVRSPTEIIARLRRLADDISGAFGRLQHEFFIPLIQRVLDILDQAGVLPEYVEINSMQTELRIMSALAASQRLEEAMNVLRFYEVVVSLWGPERARLLINEERLSEYIRDRMNVDAILMNTKDERTVLEQQRAEAQAAIMAAQASGINVPPELAADAA